MIIKKLDRRNNGHENFKYYAKFSSVVRNNFHEVREWCWDTWGPSKELSEWLHDTNLIIPVYCQNDHWTWQNDNYCCRIYLRGDPEMVFFKLRWE